MRDRVGRFELADGGTLLLNEVEEIPFDVQGKLLRVLQECSFERVGKERTRDVDIRLVAATNRDLKKEVRRGQFREDLYFRLNVFPRAASQLRERPEDIGLISQHFLKGAARRLNIPEPRLTEGGARRLALYIWLGTCANLRT